VVVIWYCYVVVICVLISCDRGCTSRLEVVVIVVVVVVCVLIVVVVVVVVMVMHVLILCSSGNKWL
jgi:hypothetical protein